MVRNLLTALTALVLTGYLTLRDAVADTTLAVLDRVPTNAAGPQLGLLLGELELKLSDHAERGQLGLGTILAAFAVVIAAFVVLIVVDQFDASLGTPSSGSLSTAQNDILTGFGDMASLIQPLLLIAIGVVIIGLIRRIQ